MNINFAKIVDRRMADLKFMEGTGLEISTSKGYWFF